MREIAKRTAVAAILLLIIPIILWISDWHWSPGSNETILKWLYWVTITVTPPWCFFTSALMVAYFVSCLHFYLIGKNIKLIILLCSAILLGQSTKCLIKVWMQEPRPFVIWLKYNKSLDEQYFYSLHTEQRSALVVKLLKERTIVPMWLSEHWQYETDFSFPSGHTLFSATWALLGVGLLWQRRYYKTTAFLMIWATVIIVSRLMLGMHWPCDLVMATSISWLLATLTCWLVQRS